MRRIPIPGIALVMIAEILSNYTGYAIYPFPCIDGQVRYRACTRRKKVW